VSDDEGRVLQLDFGDVHLINAYFPSGTSGEERQTFKYAWLDEFFIYLGQLKQKYPKMILCGDYNIAHKEIDIHNPKGNVKTSGFLSEERAWMDNFFENGWIDSFRLYHPEPHRYSWWSKRFPGVRENNKGWRIDYINVTSALKQNVIDAEIYPNVMHSDHCPVYVEMKKLK
jgi:exodeoxyribonuclease-3